MKIIGFIFSVSAVLRFETLHIPQFYGLRVYVIRFLSFCKIIFRTNTALANYIVNVTISARTVATLIYSTIKYEQNYVIQKHRSRFWNYTVVRRERNARAVCLPAVCSTASTPNDYHEPVVYPMGIILPISCNIIALY